MKHTPGPWTVISDPLHFHTLSTVVAGKVCSGLSEMRVDVGGSASLAEQEANARLIAAAPDLLEALIEVFEDKQSVNKLSWIDKTATAIAKATGGEE